MNEKELTKSIIINALIAAIYCVLTIATSSISYLGMQIRLAEALILLCFFRRDLIIGLTLGCFLANINSPLLPWDLIFGTAATLLSCLLIIFMKQLFVASLIPVILNGFIVGAELYFIIQEPFWLNVGLVALGEFIAVSVFGYIIFMILGRNKNFLALIGATQNTQFKW